MAKHGYGNGINQVTPRANWAGPMNVNAAGDELRAQHPHPYWDAGPHHGTGTHKRHESLGGLKPNGTLPRGSTYRDPTPGR